jgi:hypothetical protein
VPPISLSLVLVVAQVASAQGSQSVVGEVTAVAADSITVRTDDGSVATVTTSVKTVILRSRPGATSLADATPIAVSEIAQGDRLLARAGAAPDGKSFIAQRLVVMKRVDLEAKREQEQAEWRRRGIGGVVTALDPATRQFTVRVRGGNGGQAASTVIVPTAEAQVAFRRYAPDSVAFSDARAGSFADLTVGDQVRILGRRSDDGGTVVPEQIVSGAFRTLQGQIAAVDVDRSELTLKTTLEAGRSSAVKITVGPRALVRRLTGGLGGGPPTQGSAREGGDRREGGGMRRGGLDEIFERLPASTLAEFKSGEETAVLGTRSADPTHMTAMKVLGGLPAAQPSRSGERGGRRGGGGIEGLESSDDMLGFGGEVPW